MRKKQLLKLNEELFERCERAKMVAEQLKVENEDLKQENKNLNLKLEQLMQAPLKTEPLKTLEEKIITNANLAEDTVYGAEIIGKTVVSATKYCNKLTCENNDCDVKELVNLILGRTEVAKAEILKIVSSECSFEEKQNLIDKEYSAAEEYFISIMAQR